MNFWPRFLLPALGVLAACAFMPAQAQSFSIGPSGISFQAAPGQGGLSVRLDQHGLQLSQAPGAAPTRSLHCAGRAVRVVGNNQRLNLLGVCPQVHILGNANAVSVQQLGSLVISGSGNRVTWARASSGSRPVQSVTGSGNQLSGGAAPVTARPVPRPSVPARPAAPAPVKRPASPQPPKTATPL